MRLDLRWVRPLSDAPATRHYLHERAYVCVNGHRQRWALPTGSGSPRCFVSECQQPLQLAAKGVA